MAGNKDVFFPTTSRFVDKTGTAATVVDLILAGANGSKVLVLQASCGAGSVEILYHDGSISHVIWADGAVVSNINVLLDVAGTEFLVYPVTSAGNTYFNMAAGSKLELSLIGGGSTGSAKVYVEDY